MDKAERALELAEKLDKFGREEVLTTTLSEVAEVAAILRDYHSLRKKYDALLNAEPVATVSYHRFRLLEWLVSNDSVASGTMLIAKPTE